MGYLNKGAGIVARLLQVAGSVSAATRRHAMLPRHGALMMRYW